MPLGDLTSQSASWQTGAMSVLAFGGGRLSKITRRYLKETDKYDQFYRLFELRYNSVFGNDSLKSDDFEFVLPSNSLPQWGDYSKCNPSMLSIKNIQTF